MKWRWESKGVKTHRHPIALQHYAQDTLTVIENMSDFKLLTLKEKTDKNSLHNVKFNEKN